MDATEQLETALFDPIQKQLERRWPSLDSIADIAVD